MSRERRGPEEGVDGCDFLEEGGDGSDGVPEYGREVGEGFALFGEFEEDALALVRVGELHDEW